MHGVMKNCMLAVFSLLLCLVAAELTVRALHLSPAVMTQLDCIRFVDNPELMYELIPGGEVDGSRINAQGFKDSEFSIAKPQNLVRIVMLGDSITHGWGVPLGQTFSDRLETLLNERSAALSRPTKYEVMNFGVVGYNLACEWVTLKEKAIVYQPDIVVLNFFHNDGEPLPGCFFSDLPLDDFQRGILLNRYYQHRSDPGWRRFFRQNLYKSELFVFILSRTSNFKAQVASYVNTHYNKVSGDEAVYEKYIKKIIQLRDEKKFKLLICLHSHLLYGVHSNNETFARILDREGIPYFNMIDYYERENIKPDSIQRAEDKRDTCHPNAAGHLIIAKAMMTELRKHHFLDGGS